MLGGLAVEVGIGITLPWRKCSGGIREPKQNPVLTENIYSCIDITIQLVKQVKITTIYILLSYIIGMHHSMYYMQISLNIWNYEASTQIKDKNNINNTQILKFKQS